MKTSNKLITFSTALVVGAAIFGAIGNATAGVPATVALVCDSSAGGFTNTIGTCSLSATVDAPDPTLSLDGGDGVNCPYKKCSESFVLTSSWSIGCIGKITVDCPGLNISKTFFPSGSSTGLSKSITIEIDCQSTEACTFKFYRASDNALIMTEVATIHCKDCT